MYFTRHATPQDYDAIAAIRNQVNLDQTTGAELRQSDEFTSARPGQAATRIVADVEGAVGGYALVARFEGFAEGTWWVHVTTRPDLRRRGIGRTLYRAAVAFAQGQGARELQSACKEDAPEAVAWAGRLGFVTERPRAESILDLAAWDAAANTPHVPGLQLCTLAEVRSDAVLHALYAFEAETSPDNPGFQETLPPFEDWVHAHSCDQHTAVALAMDGELVVGASILQTPSDRSRGCYIRYTGVRREYRGRGVARAVKLLSINDAAAKGYPFLWTHNDLENTPILRANERLGFRREAAIYSFRKPL